MRMASIHHHFPNKEALRKALIGSYPERITHELASTTQSYRI